MMDQRSGRARGFGFITYEEDGAVDRCMALGSFQMLDGQASHFDADCPLRI